MDATIKKRKRVKHTRFPNGFGSIVFLKGNRRKPYCARKTKGFNEKGYPQYLVVGYYETFEDAFVALSEYNNMPYNVKERNATFKDIADKWLAEYLQEDHATGTVNNYRAICNKCEPLHNRKITDITFNELQDFISGLTAGRQTLAIIYLRQVFRHALKREIIRKDPTMYLRKTTTSVVKRNPLTTEEVRSLWKLPQSEARDKALIMLYTGMRIGEFQTISERHENYIIAGEKTEAGRNRIIPLHTKIRPLMRETWTKDNSRSFRTILPEHTPHDCRRTFISRCVECGIDGTVARKITGHAGIDVHESAYTFLNDPDFLCREVEKICY